MNALSIMTEWISEMYSLKRMLAHAFYLRLVGIHLFPLPYNPCITQQSQVTVISLSHLHHQHQHHPPSSSSSSSSSWDGVEKSLQCTKILLNLCSQSNNSNSNNNNIRHRVEHYSSIFSRFWCTKNAKRSGLPTWH